MSNFRVSVLQSLCLVFVMVEEEFLDLGISLSIKEVLYGFKGQETYISFTIESSEY